MNKGWTREQALSICDRRGTLLLSAAAGSGKTAVLVERVVRMLSRKRNPVMADKLVIATFSREAAGELRQRIDKRISELLQQNPQDEHLQRQQILLQKANISTINSFCMKIVREHFQELDLSSNFRIADESELDTLQQNAVEEAIEEQYQSQNPAFHELVEFLSRRDDRAIGDIITKKIYPFLRSLPFEFRWLDQHLADYAQDSPILETEWGKILVSYAQDILDYAQKQMRDAVAAMVGEEKLYAAYEPGFSAVITQIEEWRKMLSAGDWDTFYFSVRDYAFPVVRVYGYTGHPLKERVSAVREEVKKQIKSLSGVLSGTQMEFDLDRQALYPKIKALFDTVKLFHQHYSDAKREREIADFSDMEHFALKLLVEETAEGYQRTPLARRMAEEFDYLLIDEYQDTNEAQDTLFAALSKEGNNLFMVGDVKQSIYRFRQAMPEIFLKKRQEFAPYDRRHYPAAVILGKNFRSRKQVTDFVNDLFSQLMRPEIGEIDYNEEEMLFPGAVYQEYDAKPEFHIIDANGMELAEDKTVYEACHVADTIRRMLDEQYLVQDGKAMRPCRPRDFCILLRSPKGRTSVYAQQLDRLGIRSWADTSGDFLSTREISVLVSLLQVIDNPLQDVPLIAVMLSPMFSFTPDDLAEVRLRSSARSFYLAVTEAAEQGNDAALAFLKRLTEYRQYAAVLPVSRLIGYILDDTDYLDILQVMEDPAQRRANVRLLEKYAADYSAAGYLGVSGFLRFIDRLKERGGDLKSASKASDGENAVRIMSIHSSKGLEFPICIVADCGRKFNKTDLREESQLNARLGFAMKMREPERLKKYPDIPYEAVRIENERLMLSEEMRVLYVALTRAKEKLIVTMSVKNLETKLKKLAPLLGEEKKLPAYALRSAESFGEWILMALFRHPDMRELHRIADGGEQSMLPFASRVKLVLCGPEEESELSEPETGVFLAKESPVLLQRLESQIEYQYPYEDEMVLPSKLSVTQITTLREGEGAVRLSSPAFLREGKLTGAEAGTAVHTFLQFADFRNCRTDLAAELERMEQMRFITEQQRKAIAADKLKAFFRSDICGRILQAEQVYREYKFMYEIPAKELYEDTLSEEKILVQGIADCVIAEEDGLTIVDYKTDKVERPEVLQKRYASQLGLYRMAISEQFGKPIKRCVLYSVWLEQEIEI